MMRRLRRLFHKPLTEKRLDAELRFHMERQAAEYVAAGMSEEDARRRARREIGGIERVKEECREARRVHILEDLAQDVRYGLRMLRRSPGFTIVAVLTVALGIASSTAIFSLLDFLLFKSLPVRDPQQLVVLKWAAHTDPDIHHMNSYGDCREQFTRTYSESCSFSHPFYNALIAQSDLFSGLTGFGGRIQLVLSGNGPAGLLRGQVVAGNYFDVLGVRSAIGRLIEPSDDASGSNPIAVLSYGYWQTAFGGSTAVLGKTVNLNGAPTTIIGVAERKFVSLTPGGAPDAWVPFSSQPSLARRWNPSQDGPEGAWIVIVGRLKPGISREHAQAAVSLLFHNLTVQGETPVFKEADAPRVILMPAQSGLYGGRGRYEEPLYLLMVAAGIILLIACANVAGLLLSRSDSRQKEMALRLALGAGRWRIARQLLTESTILSFSGGALGILMAMWLARAIVAFVANGSTRPLAFGASLDIRVLLFTAGTAFTTGILFGLAPAARGMHADLTPDLKGGAGSSVGGGHPRRRWLSLGKSLVVAQVALAVVVLIGAGLFVRTLQNLRSIDPGFDTANILNFTIDPALAGYKDAQADAIFWDLRNRLSALPGVISASYSETILLSGSLSSIAMYIAGNDEKANVNIDFLPVGQDFFTTMKMHFLEGRDFTKTDFDVAFRRWAATHGSPAANSTGQERQTVAAIVNQALVRKYLGGANPIGRRVGYKGEDHPRFVIVGVVGDAKYDSLRTAVAPTLYTPSAGGSEGGAEGGVHFELRTAANPIGLIPTVRSIVNQFDASLPIVGFQTESQEIDQLLFRERFVARLSSLFGFLALTLACVGIYGLLSYEVARRTREIGIRMALGASREKVLRLIVGQVVTLSVVGIVVGIGAAFGILRYLESVFFDVHAGDPATLAAVVCILLLVALAACYGPARRATRVDPMVALRHE